MIKRKNGKKKGFTLIELIIVLAVMAIIALIAIPNFTAVRNNSKVKADNQSCETIKRVTLTLLADETIKGTGDITLTFSSDGKLSTATETTETKGITAPTGTLSTILSEAYGEVKTPQVSGKTKFLIKIANSEVTKVTAE